MFSCNLSTDAILMLSLVRTQYLRSGDRLLWSDKKACRGQMRKMDTNI
jgi:urease accessory protein UreE